MRIQELRKSAGMTQKDLAVAIGTSVQNISHYETGRRRIPVSLLMPIKDALGCTWDELFGEEDEHGTVAE